MSHQLIDCVTIAQMDQDRKQNKVQMFPWLQEGIFSFFHRKLGYYCAKNLAVLSVLVDFIVKFGPKTSFQRLRD